MSFPTKITLVFLIIACSYSICNSTIILDSGNPPRFIRGAEVKETSVLTNQEPEQISLAQNPGIAQAFAESIISELTAYNEGMTGAMITEAKEINGRSALTMCQFSRSRMTSLSIINSFKALFVKLAMAEVQDINISSDSTRRIASIVNGEMPNLEDQFALMADDLHHFDETKHGKLAMMHFGNAVRDFTRLRNAINMSAQ